MEGEFRPSKVFLAADHGGFAAKGELQQRLQTEFTVIDMGPEVLDSDDDFTPYAEKVSRAVVVDTGSMGILICRSGVGMAIAANKIDGVRAALAWSQKIARETRLDNDTNVLSLPADYLSIDEMTAIAHSWLTTPFSHQERHQRRIEQIAELEKEAL